MTQVNYQEILNEVCGDAVKRSQIYNGNEIYLDVEADFLPAMARYIGRTLGAVLVNVIGTDERPIDGCFRLYYVFSFDRTDQFLILRVSLPADNPSYPSVAPILHAAGGYEREIQDLLGLKPVGHPNPRRLVHHERWPEGVYPLRKDFDVKSRPEWASGEWHVRPVSGEGVFEVPVGPVHAGIIEPGHFRFSVVGETVLDLTARLFYKHRGVEKLAEGKPFDQACILAERVSGVGSFSHATAFCQAVERIAGIDIPERAKFLRTLFLEMERLYNHVGDIGNLCAGTGLVVAQAQGAILKERLMRMNERVSGHRYLFGANGPGGVRRDITEVQALDILKTLEGVEKEFALLMALIQTSNSNMDRLENTGALTAQAARDHSVVGPAGRASGIDRDTRRDHPHAAYDRVRFSVPVYHYGDALARMRVRVDEVKESIGIIRQVLSSLPKGEYFLPLPTVPAYRIGLGYTESPRGEALHWVMTGPGNTIYRLKVRSPSFCNWQVVPLTVPGAIIPDFPLINKSFELSYAGNDR
ncbi:MAG TPA: NADH-quinone oxidoreductase subunit C [Nitrospiria bacterium]